MKRFVLCIVLFSALLSSVFARVDDYAVDITDDSEKTFGIAPGLCLSLVGLEPTVSVNFYNLEVTGSCAFNTGTKGGQFGFAPAIAFAYNTNPFYRGSSAAFGLEYMFLTSSYTAMLSRVLSRDDTFDEDTPGIHSLSLFYKGAYNFNKTFGLLWRVKLPVWIYASQDGETFNMNILNYQGLLGCAVIGFFTIGVGVKFMF